MYRAGVGHRTPHRSRLKRYRTQDTPAHTVNHLSTYMNKRTRSGLRHIHMEVRLQKPEARTRYQRIAHEVWHPKVSSTACMSRINTCKSTCKVRSTCTAQQGKRICMHASSCSICRIAPANGKPHVTRTCKRYKVVGTRSRRRCAYVRRTTRARCLPCLQGVHRACIHRAADADVDAALCTPRSTPAQRAQPFRESR